MTAPGKYTMSTPTPTPPACLPHRQLPPDVWAKIATSFIISMQEHGDDVTSDTKTLASLAAVDRCSYEGFLIMKGPALLNMHRMCRMPAKIKSDVVFLQAVHRVCVDLANSISSSEFRVSNIEFGVNMVFRPAKKASADACPHPPHMHIYIQMDSSSAAASNIEVTAVGWSMQVRKNLHCQYPTILANGIHCNSKRLGDIDIVNHDLLQHIWFSGQHPVVDKITSILATYYELQGCSISRREVQLLSRSSPVQLSCI